MKMYQGSIVQRGKCYHWRFRNAEGLYTSRVIKNEAGCRVTSMEEAEKIVFQWSCELSSIQQLKNREETILKIAEVKSLLHICRAPISKIEETFFEHPSAPTVSPKQRKNYHCVLSFFVNIASQMRVQTVADVTEDTAQAFLTSYWKRGISVKTYNNTLNIVKRVFRLLCKDNNPFKDFTKKSGQSEERTAFTVEQLQKIWETLTSDSFHMLYKPEMGVLYKLALYTGARCGDLCLLRWTSVDMQQKVIRFIPHKTAATSHKSVEIPIGGVLYDALLPLDRSTEYVLPHVAHRYLHNSGGISRDTKKLLLAAGLTPTDEGTTRRIRAVSRMGFHGFRHTAASLLIANGVNPLVVRDILGHTTVEMTAHYTHIGLNAKAQAIQALPDVTGQTDSTLPFSFAERLQKLPPCQLSVIGRWLDEHLTGELRKKAAELCF